MIYQQAEEACDYLLEKAKEYHIDVKWKHFSPTTPPGSSYESVSYTHLTLPTT